jgi:hypothetical protein
VSGSGFESVKNWTRLEWLNLYSTNVNDEDLRWVAALTNLKDLSLNGTNVSREGAAKLQAKLPNCDVEKNR